MPTRPVIPSSPNGWHVPVGTQFVSIAVCLATTFIGALLTISLYFMVVGLPLLVLGVSGIHSTTQAHEYGAAHPALPLGTLAAVEIASATAGFAAFGLDASIVAGPTTAWGILTGLVGFVVLKTAVARPSPPPPVVPTWHQPRSQRS